MNPLRRLLILLLALCLLVPATFAEEAGPAEKPDADTLTRFGLVDSAAYDEQGRVVSVNGFPVRTVTALLQNRSAEEEFEYSIDFVDYPFWRPATNYDGNLAVMSLVMALCAGRVRESAADAEPGFDQARNVVSFLEETGFSDIRKDDYYKETSMYTISTAMGSRKMEQEGDEPFTLIAVAVCGGNYKNEWQSNITPGDGDLHEGFESAARLVFDRITGYIASRGIRGRVKIWISGFSRAAAVSNLTAAHLADSGLMQKEDIYAYTFATPAAVLNPPETGYENIFNILCPMDLVPQVMPADWDFGRYGRDLYIPVTEFASLGRFMMDERSDNLREWFAEEDNYSPELNLRNRLLISMALDLLQNRDFYNATIQPALVGIMQNREVSNMLATLRKLLKNLQGINAETRTDLDDLMNYTLRVFGNVITRTELVNANRNSGSAFLRLFGEHWEDAYLASTSALRFNMFMDFNECTYLMVRGPVDLSFRAEGTPWAVLTRSADGTYRAAWVPEEGSETSPGNVDLYWPYYMERIGSVTVIALPGDTDLQVAWTASGAGKVEIRQVRCGVRASRLYPGFTSGEFTVSAGDTGLAYCMDTSGKNRIPEDWKEETFEAVDLAAFLGIASPGVSWRLFLTGVLLLAALLAFLLIRLLCGFRLRKEKNGVLFWLCLAVFTVAVVEAEGAFWFFADRLLLREIWKAVASVALIAIWFLRRNVRVPDGVFPGLTVAIAADLVLPYAELPGMALLLIAALLLIFSFLRKTPMTRGKWFRWALQSLVLAALILLLARNTAGSLAWGVAALAPGLLLLGWSASGQPTRTRYATRFLIADAALLGVYTVIWDEPVLHILGTLLFVFALLLLALGTRKKEAA